MEKVGRSFFRSLAFKVVLEQYYLPWVLLVGLEDFLELSCPKGILVLVDLSLLVDGMTGGFSLGNTRVLFAAALK